jgi:hypothetical protein
MSFYYFSNFIILIFLILIYIYIYIGYSQVYIIAKIGYRLFSTGYKTGWPVTDYRLVPGY